MAIPATQFIIPDLLVNFPWPRKQSEHYLETKAESVAWTELYQPFDEDGLKALKLGDINLLASLAYYPREKEFIRLGCDLMALFFVFDEHTDVVDGDEAEKIRNIVLDALKDPQKERPQEEHLIAAMARDFWTRASNYVSPGAQCLEHFIRTFDDYATAVVLEANDREKHQYRTFDDYILIRRNTIGALPSLVLAEFGLNIPEEAYSHPRLQALREQGTDLILICNDLVSYAMEKSRGMGLHNSIELVMKEQNLDIQSAINHIEHYATGVRDSFLDNVANLPTWSEEVDHRVKAYVNAIAQWVRGNDCWHFESGRYFGTKGLEIQKTRVVTFLPPSVGYVKARRVLN